VPYTVKKIDIHVHTRDYGGIELPRNLKVGGDTYATADVIRQKYDDWGIEYGILLPGLGPECSHCPQSNEDAYMIANKYPQTFKWFMNLDPRMGKNSPATDFTAIIEFYKNMGALGIGEVCTNMPFDDPLMDNLLYHANACKMPFTIHLAPADAQYGYYGIKDSLGLPGIEKVLKKYPDIKIFGHSQILWSHMSGDLTREQMGGYPKGKVTSEGRIAELMREYPNFYGDMSAGSGGNAFIRDPDYAYRFIEEFADRLMFGTDICSPNNFFPLSGWLDESLMNGCISQENYIKISRGNAERLLGL